MRHTKTRTAATTLLAAIAGCIPFPMPPGKSPSASLTGEAYLGEPLDNASIVVETAAGDPVETTPNEGTRQGRFFEKLSLSLPLSEVSSGLPLVVKVSGGTIGETPFDGTLLGYVSSFGPDDHLHVNILTTLIVKHRNATGVTFRQAEQAVTSALHLPADIDLPSNLKNPNYWHLFDPTRFMALARANGGFDAFSDQIVSSIIHTQTAGVSLKAEGEAPVGGIASEAGKWLLDSTGEGLVAWGVDQGMDWLLSAFGYQNPTEKALDNIENELTQVNSTLTQIQSEIDTLTGQMSQLLALVQLSWDSLTSTISSLNMSSQEDVIQNQYNNLATTYTATSANLCTPAGNTMASNFAQAILSPQAYDVDQQIYDMYANLTGKNPGSNGGLNDLTSKLVDQVRGGQDVYQAYIALENYFGQLAAIQAQGLALMIGAINQPLNPMDGSGTTTAQWTATQYYNKFTSQLSQETEVFLACVDRLVVASVDVRSEIVKPVAYLSPETAAIYNRADFVASQLSTRQPSGLNIRLIGDPVVVSNWIANQQIQVQNQSQNSVVVSVNGNNINNYPATIPASSPTAVSYYLEWTPNAQGTAYTFQKETQVSVVKLNFPVTAAGSFTVTTPTQTQSLSVALYNNSFQPAGATDSPITPYGSGVFYVRVLPTWQAGTAKKTEDTHNQWGTTFTPNPAAASMTLLSYPEELDWWLSCPITYTGDILCTVVNGGTTSLTVNLNWNGSQTTTYGFNFKPNGSASANGGSQYLLCESTTQESTGNGQAMTLKSVALAPNTNTNIVYQGKQQMHSSGVAYGDDMTTNAWLNSLEIVPQQ